MSNLRQLTETVYALKVTTGSYNHFIDKSGNIVYNWDEHIKEGEYMILGGYSKFEIISLTFQATEEQAKSIVEENNNGLVPGYKFYNEKRKNGICIFATDSLQSLLTSKECYLTNPIGNAPKDELWYETCDVENAYNEWQQAEENTGEYLLIRKTN